MSIASDIRSGRKLGNALASAFPAQARSLQRVRARAEGWMNARPVTVRARTTLDHWRKKPRALALQRLWTGFFWPNYRADRVDWSQLPEEALATSRAAYLIALALALLAPVSMLWQWPAVTVGAKPVAAWSLALWPAAVGFAWGALLTGAAAANRAALLVASLLFLAFVFGTSVMELDRSHLSSVAPLIVLAVAWWGERRHAAPGRRDAVFGVVTTVVASACAGCVAAVLSPGTTGMGRWKLLFGGALGGLAGVAIALRARRAATVPAGERGPRLGIMVVALGAAVALHVYGLSARGGIATGARSLRPLLDLYAGYLWPLWYFVGAGAIFKVISTTRLVADAARDIVPGRVFTPLVVAALPLAALFMWAPELVAYPAVGVVAKAISAAGRGWFWDDVPRATAASLVRWFLLAQVAALPVLALRRRLHGGEAASLLYLSIFGWLLVYEYVHQTFAFTRSTPHSALVILFASVAQVSLLQQTTLRLGKKSSPAWPSAARLAILGGAAVLAVLQIHARAALDDARVLDEICLYVFLGVLDVGLPAALYVWASRSMARLPVTASFAVATFSAGAALSLALTLGDKLAHVGWSWGDLIALADTRAAALVAGEPNPFDIDLDLPWPWVAARGLVAFAALAGLGSALASTARRRGEDPALVRFASITAAGCGLAAFVRARPTIPLASPRWTVLLAPARQSLEIDAHFFAQYLAYALPALAMALAWRRLRWPGALALAFAIYMAVELVWPSQEAWMRSTGVLPLVGVAGLLVTGAALWATRRRMEPTATPAPWWSWATLAAMMAALAALAGVRANAERMVTAEIPKLAQRVEVPAGWARVPGAGVVFRRGGGRRLISLLTVAVETMPAGDARALLAAHAARAGRMVQRLTPMQPRSGVRVPGGVSVSYTFVIPLAAGGELPLAGTTAVLPLDGKNALVLGLVAPIDDWQTRRWDLVRVADATRRKE